MSKLCVSITEPDLVTARRGVEAALAAGAMVEVRLDCVDAPALDPEALAPLLGGIGRAMIVTWRRPRDGGRRELDDAARLRLLADCAGRFDALCDMELDLADRFEEVGVRSEQLVLSHHDLERTPDLDGIYDAMCAVPARIYKIATRALGIRDVAAHFALLDRAGREGRRLVSIAMGPSGSPTRVLGPAFGSEFSFCALERGRESAPGQSTLSEMRDLYRADRIGRDWIVTGLAAGRIDYSLSPAMHNAAFQALGIDGVYVPFQVDELDAFVETVLRPATRAVPWSTRGVSVTNPFKTEIMRFIDAVDPLARRVGAVNTVVVEGERLVGFNTDVEGAMRPLERAVGSLRGLTVAVVGAGGASRAVACGLADRGARVAVYARDPARGAGVAELTGGDARTLAELGALTRDRPDVLVNTTPLGTTGPTEDESPVQASRLRGVRLVYDLVYNPRETRLLREAREAGCGVLGGLPMLAEQASLQFELWTGRSVSARALLSAAEAVLDARMSPPRP